VQPSQSGKLNAKPFVNKEIIAIKFNKNVALLEALVEDLICKGIIIPLPKNKAYNTKLNTVPKEDSQKKKNNSATKSKDNTFNMPAALKKCINFAATVEESKDRSYFQVTNLVSRYTKRNYKYH